MTSTPYSDFALAHTSDPNPIIPCPPEHRVAARHALDLRIESIVAELHACARMARELGEQVVAKDALATADDWIRRTAYRRSR